MHGPGASKCMKHEVTRLANQKSSLPFLSLVNNVGLEDTGKGLRSHFNPGRWPEGGVGVGGGRWPGVRGEGGQYTLT